MRKYRCIKMTILFQKLFQPPEVLLVYSVMVPIKCVQGQYVLSWKKKNSPFFLFYHAFFPFDQVKDWLWKVFFLAEEEGNSLRVHQFSIRLCWPHRYISISRHPIFSIKYLDRSDEFELKFSSSSRAMKAKLGHFNSRAENELTILTICMYVKK